MTTPFESGETFPMGSRVLEMIDGADGSVSFSINDATSAQDVDLTLTYMQPDRHLRLRYWRAILEHAMKTRGVLNNLNVILSDTVNTVTPQVKAQTSLCFGSNPTIEDVDEGLAAVYGTDEVPERIKSLGMVLIDTNAITNYTVMGRANNEIVAAQDDAIALEMLELTEKYLDS